MGGDSWAVGEWTAIHSTEEYFVSHKGLEFYFEAYRCQVVNAGKGGFSNSSSSNAIKAALESGFNPDLIFWVQTSPLREFAPYSHFTFPKTIKELYEESSKLLDKTYAFLNSMNRPIYCMGGVTKLDTGLMAKYPNLIPIIPSIFEFFSIPARTIHIDEWVKDDKIMTPKFTEEIYNAISHDVVTLPPQLFWPDGCHPNRHAYKRIFDYLENFKQ